VLEVFGLTAIMAQLTLATIASGASPE
jgi:hypothetical protein